MKQYVVDAFTDQPFSGNPAAVCVMDQWPSDAFMTKMAMENNLSETAFVVKEGEKYHLRWFTPGGEIDLCGHATLASGYTLMNFYDTAASSVTFTTMSGDLVVERKGDLYEMDFPSYELEQIPVTDEMESAIGVRPLSAWMGRDLLCVLENESLVRSKTPDMDKVRELPGLLLHTTARGVDEDCVSRSYAPKLNVLEDPVCGSGHCHIVPYWAQTLRKTEIVAYQASRRGGTLYCRVEGERIKMAGKAALFSIDEIFAAE